MPRSLALDEGSGNGCVEGSDENRFGRVMARAASSNRDATVHR
jgi:hypothetical protein